MSDLIKRTEAELLAYVKGYDTCYKQFCEYLRTKQFERAMVAMACIHAMVSATVEKEGADDENQNHGD